MGATRTASPGKSAGLSRELIARAALAFIDRAGAQGLTMRALSQQLGVVPMALYRYVNGREDLLESVVTLLLDGVRDDPGIAAADTWPDYLRALAHAVRRITIDHAAAFPLVATRHPAAPWLRPPLRSLDLVEDFLHRLGEQGFTDQQIAEAYRAFTGFLLGQLLLESATRGAKISPVEAPLDERDATIAHRDGQLDLRGRPDTARLRSLLSEDHTDEEFEVTLSALLGRLEPRLAR